jgi:hypothetical protein
MGRATGTTTALLLTLLACMAGPRWAEAQPAAAAEKPVEMDPKFQPVMALNEAAKAAFASYSYRAAQRKLQTAMALANELQLAEKPEMATTHLLAGITAISGFNDLYRGLHHFVTAQRLNPKSEIPKELATPQLVQMFGKAKEALKAVGKPPTIILGNEGAQESGEKKPQPAALGLIHVPVDTAKRGFPVPLKAQAGIDVQAHKLFMYYRSQGKVKFNKLPMRKSKGVFRANIPPATTSGRYLHYYIEALDPRGRRSASNGSERSPNVVIIKTD